MLILDDLMIPLFPVGEKFCETHFVGELCMWVAARAKEYQYACMRHPLLTKSVFFR